MRNHGVWMLIGCVLPLLIIFLMPLFGMAFGLTSAILYLGCVFVMWTVGLEASIVFSTA